MLIAQNAVSVKNLNYTALVRKILHEKLSRMVVESAATCDSTRIAKII